MARTASTMIPLGTVAPDFKLIEVVKNKLLSLQDVKGSTATVIMFICNHCPFVKHLKKDFVRIAEQYQPKGVNFIAINSNDVTQYPEDSPEHMKSDALSFGYPFPYLYDPTQSVAKAYHAACTPDFFVFDQDLKCVYRGQYDDSRPDNGLPVTGSDLSRALDAIISNSPVESIQIPSIGCNIKWKNI